MDKEENIIEDFVRLIQILEDDPALKKKVLALLKLDSFNRASFLNTIIQKMILENVSKRIIEVYLYLKNDEIARRTIEYFENEDLEAETKE
jgi:predicted HTH domain antitoxin